MHQMNSLPCPTRRRQCIGVLERRGIPATAIPVPSEDAFYDRPVRVSHPECAAHQCEQSLGSDQFLVFIVQLEFLPVAFLLRSLPRSMT